MFVSTITFNLYLITRVRSGVAHLAVDQPGKAPAFLANVRLVYLVLSGKNTLAYASALNMNEKFYNIGN